MPHHIVLAHGIFGWGEDWPTALLPPYFRGVSKQLEAQNHTVIAPGVPPLGHVTDRAEKLAQAIDDAWSDDQEFHIIAHSMGGLDARCMLAMRDDLRQRCKTLIAIATPHYGSPVADAIHRGTGPLFEAARDTWLAPLLNHVAALQDLLTPDPRALPHPDQAEVRYVDVACNAALADRQSPLFALAQKIGGITREVNDGVVLRSSALVDGHEHRLDWPVDHGGAIGWETGLPASPLDLGELVQALAGPSREHLRRYADLVNEVLGP